MDSSGRVYTPGQAAHLLGVTTQTLRRYADDYGEVFEPVLQQGRQRVFDDAFIFRLQQAQAIQQANTAPSIRAGLKLVKDGVPAADTIAQPEPPPFERAVLERLTALAEMVAHLSDENRALQGRLKQLEGPREGNAELEEARKMNAYLLGELQRRSQVEGQPRPRGLWARLFGQRFRGR